MFQQSRALKEAVRTDAIVTILRDGKGMKNTVKIAYLLCGVLNEQAKHIS